MQRYLKVWYLLTRNAFLIALSSRFGASLFLTGKVVRFLFFLLFLVILVGQTGALASFTIWQVIFFFLTFNLIDTTVQLLFREVYRFRYQVVTGAFDFVLVKPLNPLFRSLLGGADLLDLLTLIPLFGFLLFVVGKLGNLPIINVLLYVILVVNGILIALSFHVFVLGVAVLTTEIDHTIMIYRDVTQMGRVPVDVYNELIRGLLTFILPVGIMMTFPAKALMGLLSPQGILLAIFITGIALSLSLRFWQYALKNYSSASS